MASTWIKLRRDAFGQPAGTVLRVDRPSQAAELLNAGWADAVADPGGAPAAVPAGSPGGDLTTDAELLDPTSALGAALRAAFVPKWKPNTAYASGEPVLNPSGQVVTANSSFTSGASYNAGNWTVVSGGGGGTAVTVTDHDTYVTLTVG